MFYCRALPEDARKWGGMKPTSRQTCARLAILKCVVGHAFLTPPFVFDESSILDSPADRDVLNTAMKEQSEGTVSQLKKLGLWKCASPKEMAFLQSYGYRMDKYEHKAATWRMECVGMLMWALQLLDSWPVIDREIDADLLKSVVVRKPRLLSKYPRLRDHREISRKRDLMELWHWRVRTRQLIEEGRPIELGEQGRRMGINSYDDIVRISAKAAFEQGDLCEIIDDDFAFLGKPFRSLEVKEYHMATSVIMERHFALNWMCGFSPHNRWDDTPTDT